MNTLLLATLLSASRVLTLDEALETARQHQPSLRQAQADVRAAQARVTQARAPLLPQLNVSARYSLGTSNLVPQQGLVVDPTMGGTSPSSSPVTNFTNGSVTLSQLIWDFGQTWNRFQAAQFNADAASQDAQTRLNTVVFGVRSAFFSALAAKELLVVAKETLANQERHFGQVQGFVEVGTRPAIDLAQARTDRANARVQLISAQNGYASAKAALNQAMGVEGPTDFDVSGDRLGAVQEENRPLAEVVDVALSNRPEVEALASRLRAQQELVTAARGAYGPSLSLQTAASGGGRDTRLSGNVTVFGLSMSWNLFNGLGDWARVQEAEANVTSLSAQVDALRQQVRLELEQAQLGVSAAVESAAATDEALQAARERLKLAEGRYETGVGNIIELGDAQLALTNAAAQQVRADFNVSTARAQLLRTLGQP
ncbi:MAG: TolC family protein [Myxococcaceae bacterium]|nr:TolC family protein [Myxococcaceae bacterium]